MSMTGPQEKTLQETHDAVVSLRATLDERCAQCLADVEKLQRFVGGNGEKGAKTRLALLERQAKVVWTTAGAVLMMVGKAIVNAIQ